MYAREGLVFAPERNAAHALAQLLREKAEKGYNGQDQP